MRDTTLRRHHAATERATALVLVPAMMLVLIVLGAIAVDLVAAQGAQRSLYRATSAAADDAAGMIDARRLQGDGTLRIDAVAADRVARARLANSDLPGRLESLIVTVDDTLVEVTAVMHVRHIFLDAVPGASSFDSVPVRVTARLDR